jgi:hypothetical protein
MTQHQLERAVARATGESIETIQRHGFISMPVIVRRPRHRRRRARSGRAGSRRPATIP